MVKFAERLKETLRINGMSQGELARRTKMSQTTINSYCVGRVKPSVDALVLICKEVGESSDYLLGLID